MSGTRPRQRAAIALAFGVQAVLIAGALALPAELSSTASVSSSSAPAVPLPVTLLPVVSPLTDGAPFGPGFPVTVKIGAASATQIYPAPGGPSTFLLDPGPDVTATVTMTLPDNYWAPSLSFSLADEDPLQAPMPGSAATARNLLNVPSPLSRGTHTFTLHLGNLAPRSGEEIVMTVTRPGDGDMSTGVIAEIVTS
jgi:hypothetical protein